MSSSSLEEYYPAIAIATLMKIMKDTTLSQHHTMVVQVSTFNFREVQLWKAYSGARFRYVIVFRT